MLLLAVVWLAACSPVFNWREVPVGEGGLIALLPCKPDRATREVMTVGKPVALQMAGCEAGGATFTVAQAVARDATQASTWLAAWKAAMTGKLHAASAADVAVETPAEVRRAASVPAPLQLSGTASDAAGQPVAVQILWFAQSDRQDRAGAVFLYQATVLGQPREAEAAATFFAGLRLP